MELNRDADVALLRMKAGKANAIGPAFLERLAALLDEAQGARALVITGDKGFFSAGLDLPGLLALGRSEMKAFIDAFGAGMLRVFDLPMPVVAAVNGHAIAGGCVLALQCDYRIIVEAGCRIGLNEAQLGIGLPPVVVETLRSQVPASSLLPIALQGKLLEPAEALRLGLVHEVVPAAELEARAVAKARELGAVPASAFAQIKAALREPARAAVRADAGKPAEAWVETWFSQGGQALIRAAVERLKKKG